MRKRLRHWLNEIPIDDPIERRLAILLQIFILFGIIAGVLAVFIQIDALRANNAQGLGVLAPIVGLICYIISLVLLWHGRFRQAIFLVTTSLILGLGLALIATGLKSSAVTLLAFALAITLAGLVGSRMYLLFAIGLSIAVVFGVAILEHLSPPLAGYGAPTGDPTVGRVVGFTLILVVLGLFLDRFGRALHEALAAASARELELEQSRAALQARTHELEGEIAARSLTEQALRKSEERYRLITENSSDLVGLLDSQARWIYASPSHQSTLGYAPANLVGQPVLDYIHPDDQADLREAFSHPDADGPPRVAFRACHADGSWRWFDITWTVITQDGERSIVAVGHDVTERKHLEAQLLQAQKLESIGRLAGGVAHDFNNLLTAIVGNTELAIDGLPANHPVRADLGEIAKSSERATMLTRQLLTFARKQVIEPHVIDLNQLILDMDQLFRRLIGAHIELITLTAPDLWHVRADASQIEQVVINLVVNARDAMPNGGKLTIETRNFLLDHDYAHRHISISPGRYVLLAISDTGTGMDEQTQERIFEPFFTTKNPGRGTGLGLATCYGIIKQHGGSIWPYSEPGHGSTFKVYLPQVEAPTEQLPQPADVGDLPRGSEIVLLAEDEPSVRALAARVLRAQGYTVLEATNGEEALALAKTCAGMPIDLLLTDVVMPRMSGKALAERLKVLYPTTSVLFISGYTDNAIVHHGRLDPGIVFLQKPFSPSALARKVRDVLDGHTAE